MRSIFESLSQSASAEQQQMQIQKKPSKWDRPDTQRAMDGEGSDDRNDYARLDGDSDRELVHGSSTVFVVEDELPPPAFTKNIVARFREMEASVGETAAAPLPVKAPSAPSRSSRSENRGVRSPAQQSPPPPPRGGEYGSEGSQDGEERGRSERRSDGRQRDWSSSPPRSTVDELPQEGTARSLLARWRTIEQEASRAREDAPRRSSAAAKRSQSTSRLEVRQRLRAAPPLDDDEDDVNQTTRYLVSTSVTLAGTSGACIRDSGSIEAPYGFLAASLYYLLQCGRLLQTE